MLENGGETDFQTSGEHHNAFQWIQPDAPDDATAVADADTAADAQCVYPLSQTINAITFVKKIKKCKFAKGVIT